MDSKASNTFPNPEGNCIVIEKDGSTTLYVMLHPLVLVNISDHWTRWKVQNNVDNPRVIGALVGIQSGRNVEIFNSFELVYNMVDGSIVIDQRFLAQKQEQFKKVFTSYDFLGLYTTGEKASATDIEIHKQITELNESPLYLLLDPIACSRADRKELPISIFESELHIVNEKPTLLFVKVPYKIETGEAERISVDHVAHITPSGVSSGSALTAHLLGVHNAISMLSVRIRILLRFLQAVKRGEAPFDHGLLRRVASLCNQLPATTESATFKHDFMNEYNDALMITYLAAITKGSNCLNELIDKFNAVNDRSGGRIRRGGGIF